MTIAITALLIIQLFYWLYFFAVLDRNKANSRPQTFPLTIVICAKNEAHNLKKNLQQVLDQDYSNLKVLVADDHSTDSTSKILEKIDNAPHLATYEVKQNKAGKKQALAEALDLVDTDLILLTDADCRPKSNLWAQSMIDHLSPSKKEIVLGYSPYMINGSLLSYWVHFEAWLVGIQYLSYAARGMPYMGVGRNLLYRKKLVSADTFSSYGHLASGDDDLTVMQIATAQNTAINLDQNSFVETESPATLRHYFAQKRRHYSTSSSYKCSHQALLTTYSLSQILFYLMLGIILYKHNYLLGLTIYLLRLAIIFPVVTKNHRLLAAQFPLWSFFLLDFGLAIHYVIFSLSVIFPKKNRW